MENPQPVAEMTDDELNENMTGTAGMSPEGAKRYYERVRDRIHAYAQNRGAAVEKAADLLLLVPDMFMLLWRLMNDSRVTGKNKVLLGSGIAYFVFPFDVLPEAVIGAAGYADDLVFAAYVLTKILGDTDPAVLREHWSGHGDLLESIQKVLNMADNFLSGDVLGKLKKMVGR